MIYGRVPVIKIYQNKFVEIKGKRAFFLQSVFHNDKWVQKYFPRIHFLSCRIIYFSDKYVKSCAVSDKNQFQVLIRNFFKYSLPSLANNL